MRRAHHRARPDADAVCRKWPFLVVVDTNERGVSRAVTGDVLQSCSIFVNTTPTGRLFEFHLPPDRPGVARRSRGALCPLARGPLAGCGLRCLWMRAAMPTCESGPFVFPNESPSTIGRTISGSSRARQTLSSFLPDESLTSSPFYEHIATDVTGTPKLCPGTPLQFSFLFPQTIRERRL